MGKAGSFKFMLRETDVKNICIDLANDGVIKVPWKLETPKIETA